MPITEEQRIERKRFIGASDVPAIMGVDPFRDIADIWCSKTMELPQKENSSMAAGTILEQSVVAWAEQELGFPLERDVRFVNQPFAANCDAVNREHGVLVEAKTCSITGFSPEHQEFGEPMTDQVPARIIVQVQTQFYCAGDAFQKAYVPVLIGQRGFCMYQIERSQEIIDRIIEAGKAFWQSVESGICPGEVPAYVYPLINREPMKETTLEDRLVDEYQLAQDTLKAAQGNFEKAKNRIMEALGDAEIGLSESGRFTYFEQERKEYKVPPAKFRVLRFKKVGGKDE